MDRRNFLSFVGGLFASTALPKPLLASKPKCIKGGWLDSPKYREQYLQRTENPYFSDFDQDIKDTGKGKVALLTPHLEKVMGSTFEPYFQGTGDCVSCAYALGIDVLSAVQITLKNSPHRWVNPCASEIIYGGGRVQIAKERYGKWYGGAGMEGCAAAEWLMAYGALLRQAYLNYDYSKYSGNVADKLGRYGVPKELLPFCKLHPIGRVTIVRTWEEGRDCVVNGYPVILCSGQGFNEQRDKDGFLRPSGSWSHSMAMVGVDDEFKRPGGLIQNSWGRDWVQGSTRHNQPAGSFWADAQVIDRMIKQGDSFAISLYAGYPIQDILLI